MKSEKLRKAFDQIYDNFPWLANIAAGWEVIESMTTPTAATNGPQLFYNPDFLKPLRISESTDLLLHETGHIFLGHHLRFGDRLARLWNVACDLALNDHIMIHLDQTGKIRLDGCFPGEGQFSDLPRGKDAEFYYDALVKAQPPKPKPEQGPGEKGEGSPSPSESTPDDSADEQSDGDDVEGNGGVQGSPRPGKSGDGENDAKDNESAEAEVSGKASHGHGENSHGENGSTLVYGGQPLPSLPGEIMPHPDSDGTESEQAEAEELWQRQVARGINDAKSCGSLPGWVEELGTELYGRKSEVNWKLYLRRFMTRHAPTRLTYTRPSRRQSGMEARLPGRHSREASNGCICADTSGSMKQAEMDAALDEMTNIMSAYPRCEVTLLQADTRLTEEINTAKIYKRWDFPIKFPLTWRGRGGTDLSPAINDIGKARKYKWLVVVTDAVWDMKRAKDPGIPTLWLCTRDPIEGHYTSKPTFGHVVRINITAK